MGFVATTLEKDPAIINKLYEKASDDDMTEVKEIKALLPNSDLSQILEGTNGDKPLTETDIRHLVGKMGDEEDQESKVKENNQ